MTLVKKTEARQWLKDVSSVPLQQSVKNLDTAYKNFFDSCKGKRKGKKAKPPRFKKKTTTQSATFTKAAFSITGNNVYLAKIGSLNPIWSRELPSDPSSVTVIKDAANRYFLSFMVEVEPASRPLFPVSRWEYPAGGSASKMTEAEPLRSALQGRVLQRGNWAVGDRTNIA